MRVALVGATGMVGRVMMEVLTERDFPVSEFIPVASARSVGKELSFRGKSYKIQSMEDAIAAAPDVAIFSAGGGTSKEFAPKFAAVGTTVIDNSSAWRMDPDKPLIVPEINAEILTEGDKIIANPNCSTIQMVVPLAPLHDKYKIVRLVISTYQSVSGTGKAAVEQMMQERRGDKVDMVYPHAIDMNCLPHIDVFFDNGYTKEEMKMVNETQKILRDESIAVTATCVRVPVKGGHSESVNITFENEFDLAEAKALMEAMPGVVIVDDPENNGYPMPIDAEGKDEIFVGRIRRDESMENSLNLWIVSDNLRKGAATNAVQIAEHLVREKILAPASV